MVLERVIPSRLSLGSACPRETEGRLSFLHAWQQPTYRPPRQKREKTDLPLVVRACCLRNFAVVDFQPDGQEEKSAQEESRGKEKARP